MRVALVAQVVFFFQTSEALLPRILELEVPRGLFPCAGGLPVSIIDTWLLLSLFDC